MCVCLLGLCSVLAFTGALWGARQVPLVDEEDINISGQFQFLVYKRVEQGGFWLGRLTREERGTCSYAVCAASQALCCLLQRQETPGLYCPWETHSSDGHYMQRITPFL